MKTEIQFDNGGGITIQTSNFCWYGNDAAQAAEIAHDCVTSKAAEVKKFESQEDAMHFEFGGERSSRYLRATKPADLLEVVDNGRAAERFVEAVAKILGVTKVEVDWEYNAEEFWDALPAKLAEKINPNDGGYLTAAEIEEIKSTPFFVDPSRPDYTAVIIRDAE